MFTFLISSKQLQRACALQIGSSVCCLEDPQKLPDWLAGNGVSMYVRAAQASFPPVIVII